MNMNKRYWTLEKNMIRSWKNPDFCLTYNAQRLSSQAGRSDERTQKHTQALQVLQVLQET